MAPITNTFAVALADAASTDDIYYFGDERNNAY